MVEDKISKGKILIVDDDPMVCKSLHALVKMEGYESDYATSGREGMEKISQNDFDLVFLDVRMEDMDGITLLEKIKTKYNDTMVILMTGYGSIEQAVQSIKLGAYDYITKPINDIEITLLIDRALEQKRIVEENRLLKRQLQQRYQFSNLLGKDHKMQEIFDIVERVSDTTATVLITGETGTGKTVIARAIHWNSPRRDKPFIEVSCGALPETLLESELFGHMKGAFTGAIGESPGKFQQADGGTILLDEICSASPALQVKLLRVLQEKKFQKVGGHEDISVDVRVIATSNSDLEKEVEKGKFRRDLYYRLNVVPLHISSLRERLGDIKLLAEHFLKVYAEKNNRKISGITPEGIEMLQRYPWPGNVRELENIIERAVIFSKNSYIDVDDLQMWLGGKTFPVPKYKSFHTLNEILEDTEKNIILKVLEENNWSRNKTASRLGINRTTLFNKMRRYNIKPKEE